MVEVGPVPNRRWWLDIFHKVVLQLAQVFGVGNGVFLVLFWRLIPECLMSR
jgi:hypothetical protein